MTIMALPKAETTQALWLFNSTNPDKDEGHWCILGRISGHTDTPATVRFATVQYIHTELQNQEHPGQDSGLDRGCRQQHA
jgi:hypothetical protein